MDRQKIPVIGYSGIGTDVPRGETVQIYEDGLVQIFDIRRDPATMRITNEKVLKQFRIPPATVEIYANRLVNSGFFNYRTFCFDIVFDAIHETFVLNYKGRSKEITCEHGERPPNEFKEIIEQVVELANHAKNIRK